MHSYREISQTWSTKHTSQSNKTNLLLDVRILTKIKRVGSKILPEMREGLNFPPNFFPPNLTNHDLRDQTTLGAQIL